VLCTPDSSLCDVPGVFVGACTTPTGAPLPNQLIIGGCNTLYFLTPGGTQCGTYFDPAFEGIGQMALDAQGRLYIASVGGDCLNLLTKGVVMPFYCCPPGDVPGFVSALLSTGGTPAPPVALPILTADMTGNGCVDGEDVHPFVIALLGG
jgi:hypothetical protein